MKYFGLVLIALAFVGLLNVVKYAAKPKIKVTEITLNYVPVATEYTK